MGLSIDRRSCRSFEYISRWSRKVSYQAKKVWNLVSPIDNNESVLLMSLLSVLYLSVIFRSRLDGLTLCVY